MKSTEEYVNLIIRKNKEAGAYFEQGEESLRVSLRNTINKMYDDEVQALTLKMDVDNEIGIYQKGLYDAALKEIEGKVRKFVSDLIRTE
jgi:hypothetical protein